MAAEGIPNMFTCPISGDLMTDPVVITITKAFDRPSIQGWLSEVKQVNPKTKLVLSHAIISSSVLVKDMISEWCKEKASAWKAELWAVVHKIVDGHDYKFSHISDARTALSALEDLKLCTIVPGKSEHLTIPPNLQCPISGFLMTDPTALFLGQTYDRCSIERWISEVCVCPVANQVFSHSAFTPNSSLQSMISAWCEEHEVELPKSFGCIADEEITEGYRRRLNSLLHNHLIFSESGQKGAAKQLQRLTTTMTSFRTLFARSEMIRQLLSPLSAGIDRIDPELHECLIATFLNILISGGNKREIAEDEQLMSLLVDSLKSGSIQTKRNAATAIFRLSSLDDNKHIIGKHEAIKHLVELLAKEGIEEAVTAILELCKVDKNKERIVQEGAIEVILSKIRDQVLVDDLLEVLVLLSGHNQAVEGLGIHGAVPLLVDVLKNSTSECCKERCIRVLHTIFAVDGTKVEAMRGDEIVINTLSQFAQSETSGAKMEADGILNMLNP